MATVTTNGIATHYERTGEGPPIVFVHGAGLDHRMWTPQMTGLKDEFDMLAYDYRGHGQTGPTTRDEYSIQMFVEDLRALLTDVDVESPVLCGHSYGGLIVGEYAVQYPDDVGGVIFADARIDFGETNFERAFLRLWPVLREVAEVIGMERFERGFNRIAQLFVDIDSGPDDEINGLGMSRSEYRWDARDGVTVAELSKLYAAADAYDGVDIDHLECPVLCVYGEGSSGTIIERTAGRLAGRLDDIRVEVVEGAGHGFTMVKAAAFSAVLREWYPTEAVVPSQD